MSNNKDKFSDLEHKKNICDEIIEQISAGKAVISILRSDPAKYPNYTTFMRWHSNDEFDLRSRYAIAKQNSADLHAERIIEVAENASKLEKDGHDNARVNAARLLVDALKWTAAKLKPKVYGDAMTHRGDADSPLTIVNAHAAAVLAAKNGDQD